MKNSVNRVGLLLFLCMAPQSYAAIGDLDPAFFCDGKPDTKPQSALDAGKKISALYKNNDIDPANCIAWVNIGGQSIWYDLTKKLNLYGFNLDNDTIIGSWPLTRWPQEYLFSNIQERLQKKGTFNADPEPKVVPSGPGEKFFGCLSDTPLRYGDLDGNGRDELVVFADRDIILFDPDEGQVIFQVRWLEERYRGYVDGQTGEPMELDPDIRADYPRYRDPYTDGRLYPGVRAYAKFYRGDFNDNDKSDLLVWYKMYESNLYQEEEGFHLVDEHFRHYEWTESDPQGQGPNGYTPMDTAVEQVEQWLVSEGLTWQKGYPSKSECEGEEGELIREAHDPLLNDPEVLE